jgi:hypothetical protein
MRVAGSRFGGEDLESGAGYIIGSLTVRRVSNGLGLGGLFSMTRAIQIVSKKLEQ